MVGDGRVYSTCMKLAIPIAVPAWKQVGGSPCITGPYLARVKMVAEKV